MKRDDALPLWQRFRSLLRNAEVNGESREPALRLAAAVLLVEMARADAEHSGPEHDTLCRELEQRFGLSTEEAQALLMTAEQAADRAVSLFSYIDDINAGFDHAQKRSILRMLWQVAYADGRLHRHEEHLMRRFADLLHLGHEDFIRLKLQILGEA